MKWNDGLSSRDRKFVEDHTFLATPDAKKYLAHKTATKQWTSLEELSEFYRDKHADSSITFLVSEQIDTRHWDLARVVYRVYYEGGAITEFEDLLQRHERRWKVRLEHVRSEKLKESRFHIPPE